MAIHWAIGFKSLRSGTEYTVNIHDANYSGSAVLLYGGAEPLTTEEDGNEDMFQPIRTQSGSIRIVDCGLSVNGAAFNWKNLLPSAGADRPVTVTANGGVVWHGFMQQQTFSGELYGGTQEREFPIQCALSILGGEDVNFNNGLKNFAYLLKEVCDTIDVKSSNAVHIDTVYVQGGADARKWLQTVVDWQNFSEEDNDGVLRAKYSLYDVLEDMCRFWGWTARTFGRSLYLTCADDSVEQSYLVLTRTQLNTLASASNDTSTGIINTPPTVTLTDSAANPIFASKGQTDYKVQGPHIAVVKAECNERDTIVQFAPQEIRDALGDNYVWVQGDGDLVGYFTTDTNRGKLTSSIMDVTARTQDGCDGSGGFCKRQIYTSAESDSATVGDMMVVSSGYNANTSSVMLQTKHPMSFSNGSLTLSGTLWKGSEQLQHEKSMYTVQMRLGIGMTRNTAKWWYMGRKVSAASGTISRGWSSSQSIFNVPLSGAQLKSTGVYLEFLGVGGMMAVYPSIPVSSNTYGYIFIDIMGGHDYGNNLPITSFEIANMSIEYSRDSYYIPTSLNVVRPRELKQDRVTMKEYSAVNTNDSKEEWNANCIFASDNNMEYGYGLLLDANGNIVSTVDYGNSAEHPEQHVANRVAAYWQTAKRKTDTELIGNVRQSINTSAGATTLISDIMPHEKVSLDSTVFAPIAIGRSWRDDVVRLSLMEL